MILGINLARFAGAALTFICVVAGPGKSVV